MVLVRKQDFESPYVSANSDLGTFLVMGRQQFYVQFKLAKIRLSWILDRELFLL